MASQSTVAAARPAATESRRRAPPHTTRAVEARLVAWATRSDATTTMSSVGRACIAPAMAWANNGRPSSSAHSLGKPMRVDDPAATSTMAKSTTTLELEGAGGFAQGRRGAHADAVDLDPSSSWDDSRRKAQLARFVQPRLEPTHAAQLAGQADLTQRNQV